MVEMYDTGRSKQAVERLVDTLRAAEGDGEFEEALRGQVFDLGQIEDLLNSLEPDCDPNEYIKYTYPGLYPICNQDDENLEESLDIFQHYHLDPRQVSLYNHGWFFRHLYLLRLECKLKTG